MRELERNGPQTASGFKDFCAVQMQLFEQHVRLLELMGLVDVALNVPYQ